MNLLLIADLGGSELGYGPLGILILMVMLIAASIILLTHIIPKPKRSGPVKDSTYESGVPLIGDARRRFNVRFYLVAMVFLLFDVELVFMYPWAIVFTNTADSGASAASVPFLFFEMGIFFAILLVGYAYAWRKGVFEYD
jgi:NADH:ubiquinone oxidoreductase subunit 3 (subunit A)